MNQTTKGPLLEGNRAYLHLRKNSLHAISNIDNMRSFMLSQKFLAHSDKWSTYNKQSSSGHLQEDKNNGKF